MSRNIRRRSFFSGLASSDLIQEFVQTLTALEVMPVLDSMNGTLIYIEDEKAVYAYHSTATDTANGSSVIEPASGVGRWFLVSSATSASGGSADRWVDPTHALLSEAIVVQDEWECRRGQLTIEASLTVDPGGSVYVTDGISQTKRPDFHQTNILAADTWRSIPSDSHLVMHTTPNKPFEVHGHLNVVGDLVCLNFFSI